MTVNPIDTIRKKIIEDMLTPIIQSDEFWERVDSIVEECIGADKQEPAQIWLGANRDLDELAICFFGSTQPITVPFYIPYPDTKFEVENLRRFAGEILKMADEAEGSV